MRISEYRIPGRQEFMLRLMQALFPDVPEITDITRYDYADLCREPADLFFGVPDSHGHAGGSSRAAEHMPLNRLAWHLCEFEHGIFKNRLKENAGDIVDLYDYRSTLGTFTEGSSSSYDNWLKPDREPSAAPRRAFNKPFKMALFFSFLLLNREECAVSRIHLYRYCMECLGITDEDGFLPDEAFSFDWSADGDGTHSMDIWSHTCRTKRAAREKNRFEELSFRELADRDILGCSLLILTMFEMIGAPDPDRIAMVQREIRRSYKEEFQKTEDYLAARAAMEQTQRAFLRNIRAFAPRALSGVALTDIHPADLFVLQAFTNFDRSRSLPSPASRLPGAGKSTRTMLLAGTGMGKSFYLQMLALCSLHKNYADPDEVEDNAALDILAKEIYGTERHTSAAGISDAPSAADSRSSCGDRIDRADFSPRISPSAADQADLVSPNDLCIISVPGRMFTFCYRRQAYRAWTDDFVTLFTNCMWHFAESFNFYSTEDPEKFMPDVAVCRTDPAVLRELPRYLKHLAGQGKLLLLLDSFDEIPAGEMRESYFRALAAFRHDYCWIPSAVGAHILLSTREMSPDTMRALSEELQIKPEQDLFRISPLDRQRRERLVENWSEQLRFTPEAKASLLYSLEYNHFFREYASTPYMLSTVCARRDHNFTFIASEFIQDLILRVKNHYPRYVRSEDEQDIQEIRTVLDHIPVVLADLALGTIGEEPPYLSRETLDARLEKALLEETDAGHRLPMSAKKRILKKLCEILVTEVGVIVPAEGSDHDFQFINHIIRYELAADGLWNLHLKDSPETYRSALDSLMRRPADFVGFLVPLLCKIGVENPALAESLVYALTAYDTASAGQPELPAAEAGAASREQVLLTAMVDLAAEHYGSSLINVRHPGPRDSRCVYAAQQTLIRRLLSSPEFRPSDREKEELRRSAAFLNSRGALIPALTGILEP